MSTITWPSTLKVGTVSYGVEFDLQMNVKRNGGIDTYGLPGGRWTATINFETELESMQRPLIESLIMSLEGGANRLQLHHLARPAPNGTLRGVPTLSANVAAGAKSLPLANCNGTLKRGDIIGVPGQFVMVLADATPSGAAMTVSVSPAIRAAVTSGTAVVWDRPTTLWIPKSQVAGPFPYLQNKLRPGISIELIEAY